MAVQWHEIHLLNKSYRILTCTCTRILVSLPQNHVYIYIILCIISAVVVDIAALYKLGPGIYQLLLHMANLMPKLWGWSKCQEFVMLIWVAYVCWSLGYYRERGRKRKPLNPTIISNKNYLFLGGNRSAVVATTTIMMIGNIERWRRWIFKWLKWLMFKLGGVPTMDTSYPRPSRAAQCSICITCCAQVAA